MAFVKACTLDELWEGEMEAFDIGGTQVLLVHVEGEGVHALQAVCPHQEVALADGRLDGRVLTCAMHLWEFDVVAGAGVNPGHAEIAKYPVKVDGDDVYVDTDGIQPKFAQP
ncbi:MAG: Rieske 2Fe-2S domain-containing protein [Sneathiellaceae bacterium]